MLENKKENSKNINSQYQYYDSALSWLSFNYRVLQEAMDENLAVFEQIKFLAVYQNNLDKFFRKGVALYRIMLNLPKKNLQKFDFSPLNVLNNINLEVKRQEAEFESYFFSAILKKLSAINIELIQDKDCCIEHFEFLKQYFFGEILPLLQPVIFGKGEVLTCTQDNVIYLTIILKKRKINVADMQSNIGKNAYAVVEIPSSKLPRFIKLPSVGSRNYVIFIDDIIRMFLPAIFPLYSIESSYCTIILRNSKFKIEDELKSKYVDIIHKNLSRKKLGMPARFIYDSAMPDDFLNILKIALNLSKRDLIPGFKYQNLSDLISFPNPNRPNPESRIALQHGHIDTFPSILRAIKKNDFMVHFPYQSFDYVIRFFNEAAIDPKVEEIKTTQYKLESNSAIVSSLISAARNGKKVSIFVDFKARFDESANHKFIDRMLEAGIQIIPSKPGHKIHAKAALVIRRKSSKENGRRGFAYISTGNYNEKTAQKYCDQGFFTSNPGIIDDLKKLFIFLEKPQESFEFSHLLIPKYNFRLAFKTLIENEIRNAKEGKKAYLLLKLNNLDDKKIINQLYEASINGVIIDLIIRGICSLVPGKPFSQNIRLIRIVDTFLEHSRIIVFENGGNQAIFISSADFTKTNLNRRIDIMVPIYEHAIKQEIIDILKMQLRDNLKARILGENLNDWRIPNPQQEKFQSQVEIYQYLKHIHQ